MTATTKKSTTMPVLTEVQAKKLKKITAAQKAKGKEIVKKIKTKSPLHKKAIDKQVKFRFDIKKEIGETRVELRKKKDKILLKLLVAALLKIKAQLEKDSTPSTDADRKRAIRNLIKVHLIHEIFEERKKTSTDKVLYKAALFEIKRFFKIFHNLSKEINKQKLKARKS